jgi:hypothetical protein
LKKYFIFVFILCFIQLLYSQEKNVLSSGNGTIIPSYFYVEANVKFRELITIFEKRNCIPGRTYNSLNELKKEIGKFAATSSEVENKFKLLGINTDVMVEVFTFENGKYSVVGEYYPLSKNYSLQIINVFDDINNLYPEIKIGGSINTFIDEYGMYNYIQNSREDGKWLIYIINENTFFGIKTYNGTLINCFQIYYYLSM